MEVNYLPKAKEDLIHWRNSGMKNIQKKISKIIESIEETPYSGIGKPEPLKHNLTGKWSRRINDEHRIVYSVDGNKIFIYSLHGHY